MQQRPASSFRKAGQPAAAVIPGTRLSAHHSQLVVSSGLTDLDGNNFRLELLQSKLSKCIFVAHINF